MEQENENEFLMLKNYNNFLIDLGLNISFSQENNLKTEQYKDEKTLSYAPTGKTLSLSAGYNKHKLFSALISPLLQEFNRIIGWPVNIGIYDYDSMLIIMTKKESGQVSFGRTFEVGIGTRVPMLGSSLGLAYLAFSSQTESPFDSEDYDRIYPFQNWNRYSSWCGNRQGTDDRSWNRGGDWRDSSDWQ